MPGSSPLSVPLPLSLLSQHIAVLTVHPLLLGFDIVPQLHVPLHDCGGKVCQKNWATEPVLGSHVICIIFLWESHMCWSQHDSNVAN
jgi:hypothetical protein